MIKLKHTPGPWKQQKYGDKVSPYILAQTAPDRYTCPETTVGFGKHSGGGYFWPAIGVGGISLDEVKANARIIAAAPEMLEMLISQVQHSKECGDFYGIKYDAEIKLIEKATGLKIRSLIK